jgi:hypothetical protein
MLGISLPLRRSGTVLVMLALSTLQLAGCGEPKVPGKCGGEERPQLSCESEFKYDGTKLEGGFSALGVGSLNAKTETAALRQIDVETERFAAQSRRLCDEYNKCIVDKETYATRAENMRRRMAKVPELLDGVRVASAREDKRRALAKAYETLIPDDQRIQVGLDFGVVAKRPGESSEKAIHAGDSLPTDSRVAFEVKATGAAHLYLFQRGPDGKFNVLFPDKRAKVENPVAAGQTVRIPKDGSFRLNEKDVGVEQVFVVASLQPLGSLQAAIDKLNGGAADAPATKKLASIAEKKKPAAGCERGLEFDGASESCSDERGLEYTPDANENVSMRVRSEAADPLIVKVFAFQHTAR